MSSDAGAYRPPRKKQIIEDGLDKLLNRGEPKPELAVSQVRSRHGGNQAQNATRDRRTGECPRRKHRSQLGRRSQQAQNNNI